jgi:PAS domain S-box-containing protein
LRDIRAVRSLLMLFDDGASAKPVLNAINCGLIVLDGNERVVLWNEWMEGTSGFSQAQARGRLLGEIFPASDLKRLASAIKAALVSSASTIITHALNPSLLPLHTKSNRTLLHNITVSPVGDPPILQPGGLPAAAGCLIFITDVTMEVNRERYLRDQQNARYDAVVANAPDVIITLDVDGFIQLANPAAIAQFGYPDSELVGKEAAALFETREAWAATWRGAMEDPVRSQPRELIARRKDASISYLEGSASRWKSGSRSFVTVILRDINERRATDAALRQSEGEARSAAAALKDLNQTLEERVQDRTSQLMKAEEALRHSQKMESIGNLTGGIAHDFNNLLQVISGNLALLKRDVLGNAAAERRVQNAMDGVSRSAKLSSQLLSFARRQALQPKVINLGRFIRDMEDILRKAVGEGVTVETIIAAGLWNTLIDPGNVENALLNLAINARDAMDGQGRLTIEAGNAFLDSEYARAHEEVIRGQYVLIAVTDTGAGMSPDVIRQAFEPFFTTKPDGRGTGLGLSMVYGFVKQSGGHIKIYSEAGQGTTIRFYLPRSVQSEDRLVDLDKTPAVGGSEMVLVAEDDESVRETVVAMLSDLGYRVLKAKDAQSALSIVESGMPIDLLFTDVVMPGSLKSTELARKARERMPNLAILFTSGYTENSIVHSGRLDENVELLSKPYSREALARKLRHVLANAAQRRIVSGAGGGAALPAPERAPQRLWRILVCEDDELIRESTVEMLRTMGYLATPASDARHAIAVLASEPVDILVTDIGLPDMSGAMLAEFAKSRIASLTVIFTTGRNPDATVPANLAARTLIKPFSFESLLAAIAAVEDSKRS